MKHVLEKFKFECVDCGENYAEHDVKYLCPSCSQSNSNDKPPRGVLKVVYDYFLVKELVPNQSSNFFDYLKSLKYINLLPINNIYNLPKLRVGDTPLYKQEIVDNNKLNFNLFLKDDSQNPTYSFKDRASSIVSAYAKENNIDTIIAASTGNAGSSMAGICASQNQKAIIIVPENAPQAKLTQIVMYGATVIPVKGTYDDAFNLSVEATKKFGWYNRNTAFNPFTIEGKKVVSYELFDQLNNTVPDTIFVPVGDGVIISSVYKGFEDLLRLGLINEMPCIIAVQSDGSHNLINNIHSDKFISNKSKTIADSISVDIPRNFYMTKKYILKYNGKCLSVSDNEILKASKILSENTGLFVEPAAATSYAGFLNYFKNNKIDSGSNNVVLLTGSGLKDLNSIQTTIKIPKSIIPEVNNILNFVK